MNGTRPESQSVGSSTAGARLRHGGKSLLPLALFVGGALGYERIADATREPTRRAATVGSTPSAERVAVARLSDERSLSDLAHNVMQSNVPAAGRREVSLTIGETTPVALQLGVGAALQPGAYAILRGVPANAILSHGIGAGLGNWLVDGAEIRALRIALRAGTPGKLGIEMTLLSSDSRPLAREHVTLLLRARQGPAEPAHIVPPSAVSMSTAAPEIDAPGAVPTASSAAVAANSAPPAHAAATSRPTSPSADGPLRLSLATADAVATGSSRVRVGIETAGSIPDGAYILFRGLPASAALSRGVSIGPDVWLLSMLELQGLELRIPDAALAGLVVAAKLVTADGRLLGEQTMRYDAMTTTGASSVATAIAAAATVATEARPGGSTMRLAAADSTPRMPQISAQPKQTEVSRPGVPAPAPAASVKGRTPALAVSAPPVTLDRGRRMLLVGNIAVARPLLERAAGEGSAEAAALLGASFDPAWLKQSGALGVADDPAQARRWYAEARRLGAQDVERIVAGATSRPAPARR